METVSSIKKVVSENSFKPFSRILMKWSSIAGPSNREIMMPLDFKKGTLSVAVPNSMVLKATARFKQKMIENIIRLAEVDNLNDIKFFIDPALFKTKRTKEKPQKKPHQICDKKTELIKNELLNMGISSDLAETFAHIEQLWEEEK